MLQLQLHCLEPEAEPIEALLEDLGALSITMTDQHDDPIFEPALGTTPLWPHVVIDALFSQAEEAQRAKADVLAQYPSTPITIEILPEQDWERVCMQDFHPIPVGKRLWICPSWSTPPNTNAVNLILDPGLAFGTGTHPTTFLCLTWLEQANIQHQQIIDFGCGSGILAIAALKLGANHATAVDIDEQALIATRSNAEINDISETQLTIGFPDSLTTPADCLIANILLTPLLDLKDHFVSLIKPQGCLVVSGILKEQLPILLGKYQSEFTLVEQLEKEDWIVAAFKRRG